MYSTVPPLQFVEKYTSITVCLPGGDMDNMMGMKTLTLTLGWDGESKGLWDAVGTGTELRGWGEDKIV